MRKTIAILFLSIYLVSITEAHEFLKIPQLIEHFIEHKSEDKSTTFIDFIVMHYSTDDDGDSDNSKDAGLPFKSHNHCENFSTTGDITFNKIHITVKSIPIEEKIHNIYSSEFISSSYLSSIWQPPKSC